MLKKILLSLALLCSGSVFAASVTALTADQIELLNNHSGSVNRQLQIGTVIGNTQTAANGAFNLTNGKILVGNVSGVAAAVTPSGDVTVSNAGVTAIGAGKVLESMLVAPATDNVLNVARVARLVWDPSGTASQGTVGSHASGVTIPANAIIRQVWFYTKTSLVSTGNNGTLAVQCNSANDIFSAADIDATSGVAGQIGAGVETGAAAAMLKVSTACNVAFVVAVNAFTAGKMDWFIEYSVAE